jgi:predicted nuclease of predicted toxin-antitoxin system
MPDDKTTLRFLADMGVSWRIVEWLRSQGYNAKHLREEGLGRLVDTDIFAKALLEQRVVLTFDLDFGEIAAFSKGQIVSVIVFRLRNTRTSYVIERLSNTLTDTADALGEGRLS